MGALTWRSPPLTSEAALEAVLDRARTVGFLGPGPISFHVKHARAFADALPDWVEQFVDIGSGGGLPGLPIALARPELHGTLLDASQKRTAFLVWAVAELGLADRVSVITGRAELIAREVDYRGQADAVVSRGFGPPAMTVECAAGLVRDGGLVVISEPPERRAWPQGPLAELGLVEIDAFGSSPSRRLSLADDATSSGPASDPSSVDGTEADAAGARDAASDDGRVVVFRRDGALPDRFPRGAKQLKRQPLFDL